jgi:energy-coupling factor transporter ATP-binding protein EcfA2
LIRDEHRLLSGPAGSGKSTVAKTVASLLARDNLLAGSFFFSRDYADRKEIRGLPGTLAHQMAKYSPDFQEILLERLNASDEPANDEPRMQFRKLFVELLSRMPSSLTPWVICLDALDECGTDRGKVLLRWLSENIEIIPAHVRFFLTGRPDVPSYVKFDRLQPLMHKYNMNKIARDTVRQDIRLYVGQSLVDESWDRPSGWRVSDRDADEITRLAGELFVFAATAVRYIRAGSPRTHPQKSVDHLLRGASLNELNDLYFRIVNEAIPTPIDERDQEHFERAKRVLGAIVHLIEPQDAESLAGLLRMDQQELKGALIGLSSVVRVPESAGVIQIVHLSFREWQNYRQTPRPSMWHRRTATLPCARYFASHAEQSQIQYL